MFKGLLSGFACGAVAALLLHGLVLALEYPLERQGIFLRQAFPAFPLDGWLRLQAPPTLDRMLAGAVWGALAGTLIQGGRMPYRMTGMLFGAVVITALGFSVIIDGYSQGYVASWNAVLASGVLGAQVMLNGAWGLLTGVLLLFTNALLVSVRNDMAGPSLRA